VLWGAQENCPIFFNSFLLLKILGTGVVHKNLFSDLSFVKIIAV
jgi:hypothetical protein